MPDHHHAGHRAIELAQSYIGHLRSHKIALIETLEIAMQSIDTLIKAGRDLIVERDALKQDRDNEKSRADELQAQIDAIDKQAQDAATDLQAEVDAEKPAASTSAAPVTASVAAATSAPTTTVVVTGDTAVPVDATLTGPGIAPGTTVDAVSTTTDVDGSAVSTLTLSQPTVEDHLGDQSETIVATPAV